MELHVLLLGSANYSFPHLFLCRLELTSLNWVFLQNCPVRLSHLFCWLLEHSNVMMQGKPAVARPLLCAVPTFLTVVDRCSLSQCHPLPAHNSSAEHLGFSHLTAEHPELTEVGLTAQG